ncbi:hypothetical protein CSQ94_27530 [Janthinobacterium sp. BJB312]|nr:hypothetical protein CSQ94_27530 [Janthinobacterium sp. BJB312]
MAFIRPDTLGRSSFFMNVRVGGERCGDVHRVDISLARIATTIPDLQRDPDRLLVFAGRAMWWP